MKKKEDVGGSKKLEVSITFPSKGRTCLAFEYTTNEQKVWAHKQIDKYIKMFGSKSINAIVMRRAD